MKEYQLKADSTKPFLGAKTIEAKLSEADIKHPTALSVLDFDIVLPMKRHLQSEQLLSPSLEAGVEKPWDIFGNQKIQTSSKLWPYFPSFNSSMAATFVVMEQQHSQGKVGLSEFYLEKTRQLCPICSNQRFYFHQPLSNPPAPSRSNQWSERENIFLVGIVLNIYHIRHSLKPTNAEKILAKAQGLSPQKIIWQNILLQYHIAIERYFMLSGEKTPLRTVEALQKHWKETGSKQTSQSQSLEENFEDPETKRFERIWEEKYNSHFVLTCSDKIFNSLIRQLHEQCQDVCNCCDMLQISS